MRIALLPRKTRGGNGRPRAAGRHRRHGEFAQQQSGVSAFTAALLERGTAKHDRQAFDDALDRLRAKVDIGLVAVRNRDGSAKNGSCERTDVLRLIAEALREPSFVPSGGFDEQLKRERLSALEAKPAPIQPPMRGARGARRQSRIRRTTFRYTRHWTRKSPASRRSTSRR
jgi:zinc protease